MDITGIAKSHHADISKASSKKEWKLSDSLREKMVEYKTWPYSVRNFLIYYEK